MCQTFFALLAYKKALLLDPGRKRQNRFQLHEHATAVHVHRKPIVTDLDQASTHAWVQAETYTCFQATSGLDLIR